MWIESVEAQKLNKIEIGEPFFTFCQEKIPSEYCKGDYGHFCLAFHPQVNENMFLIALGDDTGVIPSQRHHDTIGSLGVLKLGKNS